MSDPNDASTNGTDRIACYLCGERPAKNRAVIEGRGHHASNMLLCDDCQDDERVIL